MVWHVIFGETGRLRVLMLCQDSMTLLFQWNSSVIRYEACKKHPEGRERPPTNHTPYHGNVHNVHNPKPKNQGAKKETVTLKVLRPLTICFN